MSIMLVLLKFTNKGCASHEENTISFFNGSGHITVVSNGCFGIGKGCGGMESRW